MRVLVTGASGLIGRHTVEHLLHAGHTVRTFQRSALPSNDVEHVTGDVEDLKSLCAAAKGCAAVVHLAGRGDVAESRRDPVGYVRLNADGALHALEAARHAGAAVVLASTQRVYALAPGLRSEDEPPAPDSPYGFAKWTAEQWCRMESEQYGVPTSVLRFFSVYGPGQQPNGVSGVVTIFVRAALAGQPLVVQSAGRRDFTDARDIARGIDLALSRRETRYRVLNIATGVGTTFRSLAETVVAVTGSSSPIEGRSAGDEGADLVADITCARTELGYEPTIALREGLEHYVNWLREQARG